MHGALKITFNDGTDEFFEVEPIGDKPDFVQDLKAFLESPDITLITETELIVIPSTSIRQIAITRSDGPIPEEELAAIPGVLVGVKRIVG